MGAPRLSTFVHVVEMVTNDQGKQEPGRSGVFGPGDSLPDWAVAAISNPDVWDGDPPARPESSAPGESREQKRARLLAQLAELGDDDGADESPQDGPPPKGGPGSGAPAWREYAASKQVEVAENASREDVWEALDAAGVPTE